MPRQVTTYSLEELKEQFPDAYERVHARWVECCDYVPWADETMDSLRAVIKACGATLKDWSIGAYNRGNMLRVSCDDDYWRETEDSEESIRKDAQWLLENVLAPNGYVKDGKPYFPGLCKFTGYCADDDFLESVAKDMASGSTLTEALEALADVAGRMMEGDLEQQQDEDSMLANWEGEQFTEDGIRV